MARLGYKIKDIYTQNITPLEAKCSQLSGMHANHIGTFIKKMYILGLILTGQARDRSKVSPCLQKSYYEPLCHIVLSPVGALAPFSVVTITNDLR